MSLLCKSFTLICAAALMSCASPKKKDMDEPAGGRMKSPDRLASDSLKRAQEGKMSTMDQKTFSASKAFGGGKTEFKTGAFTGEKAFHTGKGDFMTGTFAQGKKETRDAGMTFESGKTNSGLIDKSFVTHENSMGGKQSSANAQSFGGGDTRFYTKENYAGEKALRETRKPQIIGTQTSYSEEEVKRLLNKQ